MAADGDTTAASWAAGSGLVVGLLGFAAARWMDAVAAQPTAAAPEVYVSERGAVVAGEFVQWRGFGHRFIDAEVVASPPAIRVRFGVQLKHGEAEHERLIPVPADGLDEAAEVAQAIRDS